MKEAVSVDARTFVSNLLKRVAKNENADGDSVLKSIEDVVSEKCNDLEGTLRTALKT